MHRKTQKSVKPPDNANLEFRRLEVEEKRLHLDEQRFAYEMKKAPSNLTKGLAVTALVVSFLSMWPNALATLGSARFALQGKDMEVKNQEATSAKELKFKVMSFLMNNWRDLNNRPPEEKRFFASLIADALPEPLSIQLLDHLEKASAPATKGIWRDAKVRIVSAQHATLDAAPSVAEKVTAPTPESKLPEWFTSASGMQPANASGTFGSNAWLANEMGRPAGRIPTTYNAGAPLLLDGYASGTRGPLLSASLKDISGTGDGYLIRQLANTPSEPSGSQVTVTFTNGQLTTDLYGMKPAPYLSVTATSNYGIALGNTGPLAVDTSIRASNASGLDAVSIGKAAGLGIDSSSVAGWSLQKALSGTDTLRLLDTPSGVLTTDAAKGRAIGYSPFLLDVSSSGSPLPRLGGIKLERVVTESAPARIQ